MINPVLQQDFIPQNGTLVASKSKYNQQSTIDGKKAKIGLDASQQVTDVSIMDQFLIRYLFIYKIINYVRRRLESPFQRRSRK